MTPPTTMALTGHKQLATMLRYNETSAQAQRRAQEALDEYRHSRAYRVAEEGSKVERLTR